MAGSRTVRVFQHAVEELVDSPGDPIIEKMALLAEDVREHAMANLEKIIPTIDPNIVVIESGKDTKGLFFRIKFDGQGHQSAYLSRKELVEHAILLPAVDDVLGAEHVRVV